MLNFHSNFFFPQALFVALWLGVLAQVLNLNQLGHEIKMIVLEHLPLSWGLLVCRLDNLRPTVLRGEGVKGHITRSKYDNNDKQSSNKQSSSYWFWSISVSDGSLEWIVVYVNLGWCAEGRIIKRFFVEALLSRYVPCLICVVYVLCFFDSFFNLKQAKPFNNFILHPISHIRWALIHQLLHL